MEFITARGHNGKTLTSSGGGGGGIKLKQKIVIKKKFDPQEVLPSTVPNEKVKSENSHVKVVSASLPDARWPKPCPNKRDIECKPWYLRTFEEVYELELGDEVRAEKYLQYNKSFTSKIDPNIDYENNSNIVFGSLLQPKRKYPKQSNTLNPSNSTLSSPSYCKATATSANRSMKLTPPPKSSSQKSSDTSSVSSKNDSLPSKHKITKPLSRQQQLQHDVTRDVKLLKLKPTELRENIVETTKKLRDLQDTFDNDYIHMQTIMTRAETSSEQLERLNFTVIQLMVILKRRLNHIIEQRRSANVSHRALETEIKRWESSYYSQMHLTYSKNIEALETLITTELRRDERKRLVVRGLKHWARMVLRTQKASHNMKRKIN